VNSLKVTFTQNVESGNLLLELDEEKNNGLTRFPPGQNAYLRLFPAGANPQILCNMGSVEFSAKNLPLEVEEDILVVNSDSAATKYPVSEIVSVEWLGKHWGNGTVRVDGSRITFTKKVTGVLRVSYRTYYDELVASCDREGTQLIVAQKETGAAYINVSWVEKKKEVVLVVKDACTRAFIEGAKVYVDGKFVGLTDSSGRINLGKVPVGKHSLRVVKEGYQPTDEDNIKNDYFIVSDG